MYSGNNGGLASITASESKGTPFSKNAGSQRNTCVKIKKQGEGRYSSSPLGKRLDIYETTETEEDFNLLTNRSDQSKQLKVMDFNE